MKRQVRILGTGMYLPKQVITAEDIDYKIGTSPGWVKKKSGVLQRRFVSDETASQMGAEAARGALQQASLELADIDCIVSASGTVEQAIPCTASLIYREMDAKHMGIPAFDLNATCLSFVAALDHLSYLITAGRYRHILLISTEIASVGLNWKQKESASLFGDGAVAVVIGPSNEHEQSGILAARMETYTQGATYTEIRGGGTKLHPRNYENKVDIDDFLFDMDGEAVFKLTSKYILHFVNRLLASSSEKVELIDVKLVIPHQASMMAMKLIQKRLKIKREQLMIFAHEYGNMIAASIPLGLHLAISSQQIQRGDRLLLIGTSAGLSFGGVLLDY